jgi:hypothetical protein
METHQQPVDLSEQTLEDWRATMFEELGFSQVEAAALAVARDYEGWHIALADVTKMVENGCSLELVLRIVL